MDFGRAFGAGGAGTPFDPMTFITKPQVVLRLTSILFSMIVFGCLAAGGDEYGICIMNGDSNACRYGIGIGVIAFIAAIAFVFSDAVFEQVSSVQTRKYITIGDLAFSGLWTFLWFVGFCYMTNQWRVTSTKQLDQVWKVASWKKNNVRASIAFSFFSIIVWAGLTYLALQRYREGAAGTFRSADDLDDQLASGPGSYQQPPLDEPIMPGDGNGGMGGGLAGGMGAGGSYQTGGGY